LGLIFFLDGEIAHATTQVHVACDAKTKMSFVKVHSFQSRHLGVPRANGEQRIKAAYSSTAP
jgi:hypothetical protein